MSETSDFGTFGRYSEIPLAQMTPEQSFAAKRNGGNCYEHTNANR